MIILALLLLAFTNNSYISGVDASGTFSLVNNCPDTVWPGIFSDTTGAPISTTGFALPPNTSSEIRAPSGWVGRFWARTHCSKNSTGKFTCLTGDCGSGKIECNGGSGALPVTMAEFTLGGAVGEDFYDVSLVDGYNIPLSVEPQGGSMSTECTTIGCAVDLNSVCPAELKVTAKGGENVGCKSACAAFNQDKYCCRGAYSTPNTCVPSSYSKAFKSVCPSVCTYAQDNASSTFTCASADYRITFCSSLTTRVETKSLETKSVTIIVNETVTHGKSKSATGKSSGSQNQLPDGNNNSTGNVNDNNFIPSAVNRTMIFHGETDFVNSRAVTLSYTTSTCMLVLRFARTVAVTVALMRKF